MDSLVVVSNHFRPWVERAAIAAYGLGVQPAVVLGCDDCDANAVGGPVATGVRVQDPEALATAVRSVCPSAALVSWEDDLVVPVAHAAALLDVPHPAVDGLERVRNKASMRRRLLARGVPGPRFHLVDRTTDLRVVADAVGFPAIVKPVNGTGSALVRRVDGVDDLAAAVDALTGLPQGALGGLLDRRVADPDAAAVVPRDALLVEECLVGPEVDVEVVVRDGDVVPHLVSEVGFAPGSFRETYFVSPPVTADGAAVAAVLERLPGVLRALGVDDCVANVTFIVTPDRGPVLVEVNAGRPGGHLLAGMAWHRSGVDLTAEAVALACGLPGPERVKPAASSVAAMSFYPSSYGRIADVRGLAEVSSHPRVLSVVQLAAVGEEFADTHTTYPAAALVREVGSAEELHALRAELDRLVEIVVHA